MDNLDKKIAIDDFVSSVAGDLKEVKLLIKFLRIDDEKQKAMIEKSIDIFESKLKKLKKVKSLKEADEYIKVNKIIKKTKKKYKIKKD